MTKTIKLGTGVCLVVQRDPIQTAKLVASLDQVSGGRFLFGVGGGWNAEEMEDHGTAFKTRFKLMRERIEAMKEIWTEDQARVPRRIRRLRADDGLAQAGAEAAPADYRRRRLPACRAARVRYGDGWMPHASRPQYADVTDYLPQFRQMAAEAGRDRAPFRSRCGASAKISSGCGAGATGGGARRRQPAFGQADKILPILDRWAELIRRIRR